MTIPGHATLEGTSQFRGRFRDVAAEGTYREAQSLWFCSLGLGTYLGDTTPEDDRAYRGAVREVVRGGVNLIDTAVNYRYQRSERAVGEALGTLLSEDGFERRELIIATKGGFVPFDGSRPEDPDRYILDTFIEPGVARREEFVSDSHCIGPDYLEHQIHRSRENLGLGTLDVYFIHNPETQLQSVSQTRLFDRLERAFERLEHAVSEGWIRRYGLATWNAFRQRPGTREYLSLSDILERATRAGGEDHHLEVLQLPFNLGMPEAFTLDNQNAGGQSASLLQVAKHEGLTVISSAALLQGRLSENLPEEFTSRIPGLDSDALQALQFARSAPGVTSSLVGMKSAEHIDENLEILKSSPLSTEEFLQFFEEA